MTISEQIREAALYAVVPYFDMPIQAFYDLCEMKTPMQLMDKMPDTDLRTFMLLVAEALE